jgi:hypothetical protein
MHRLGLADHVESSDYVRCPDLFKDGLTEEQVQLIRELFASRLPPPTEGDLVGEDDWLIACSPDRSVMQWDRKTSLSGTCAASTPRPITMLLGSLFHQDALR